jgi:signal transduction histidine kinase
MDKLSLALIGPQEPVIAAAKRLLDYITIFQPPFTLQGVVIPEEQNLAHLDLNVQMHNDWQKLLARSPVQILINMSQEQSLKRKLRQELDLNVQLVELNEKQIQTILAYGTEDQIKPVLSHIPYPTLLTKADGTILFANNSIYQLSLFENINLRSSKAPNLFQYLPKLELEYRDNQSSVWEFVSKSVSLNHNEEQWEFTFIQVPKSTTHSHIVWLVHDLKGEEEEKRLNAAMSVVGAISHELSQPITAIVNSAQLLLSTPQGNIQRLQRHKEIISNESERIFDLYRKLRTINKYKLKNYLGTQIFDIEQSSDFSLTMPSKEKDE